MALKGEQEVLWERPKGKLLNVNMRWRVVRWNGWYYPVHHLPLEARTCRVTATDHEFRLSITDEHGEHAKEIYAQSM